MSVHIDEVAVYVPQEYIGMYIQLVESGDSYGSGMTCDGKVVSARNGGAVSHYGRARKGVRYEVWCHSPREFLGYSHVTPKNTSSSSYNSYSSSSYTSSYKYREPRRGKRFLQTLGWVAIIGLVILALNGISNAKPPFYQGNEEIFGIVAIGIMGISALMTLIRFVGFVINR